MKLRAPISTDADWITRACQDPDIQRWTTVPVPYHRPDAEAFIATWAGSLLVRAVVDAATDSQKRMAATGRTQPSQRLAQGLTGEMGARSPLSRPISTVRWAPAQSGGREGEPWRL